MWARELNIETHTVAAIQQNVALNRFTESCSFDLNRVSTRFQQGTHIRPVCPLQPYPSRRSLVL